MQTKALPDLAFDPVAPNRCPDLFARNGHPKTGMAKFIRTCQERQVLAATSAGPLEDTLELCRTQQFELPAETPVCRAS